MLTVVDVREWPEEDQPPWFDGETEFPWAVYAAEQLVNQWETRIDAEEFARCLEAYMRFNISMDGAIYPAEGVQVFLHEENANEESFKETSKFFLRLAEGQPIIEALNGELDS